MKRNVLVVAVLLLTLAYNSYASIVSYEDFERPLSSETGMGMKLWGASAESGEITDSGKQVTVLTVKDEAEAERTAVQFNFNKTKSSFAAEVKFKIRGTMNNVYVSAGQGNSTLSRLQISKDGRVSINDGAKTRLFDNTVITSGNWITVRICYNHVTGKADVRCNSEILRGLGSCGDYSGEGIDYILIQSGYGINDILVDYYLVEEGSGLNAEVRPIEPDYIDEPVSHARTDVINIKYNGKYKFFDYAPVMRNERVLIPFRRAFEMLGLEIYYNESERTAIGKNSGYEVKIADKSNVAYVNGAEKKLDVVPEIIDDSFYVPVRFVAEAMNKKVDWDVDERTVIIED